MRACVRTPMSPCCQPGLLDFSSVPAAWLSVAEGWNARHAPRYRGGHVRDLLLVDNSRREREHEFRAPGECMRRKGGEASASLRCGD